MKEQWAKTRRAVSRREILARLGAAGAGVCLGAGGAASGMGRPDAAGQPLTITGLPVEVSVAPVSARTLRLTVLPILPDGRAQPMSDSLVLAERTWPKPVLAVRSVSKPRKLTLGTLHATLSFEPLTLSIVDSNGRPGPRVSIQAKSGAVTFPTGEGPLFGLGEGGQQLDRRGAAYPMKHGQDVLHLDVLGARMAIPWLLSPEGWALFFHRPLGSLDLTGSVGQFEPQSAEGRGVLPLDLFLVTAREPSDLLSEYAQITGFPHLPPIWALGYQQSHRTLSSREEVLSEAQTFREKKLPCDVLIYLGTGFCPSGWNTGHGSFTFNKAVFPDPATMIQEFHHENFKVVPHVVIQLKDLHGDVKDSGAAAQKEDDAANYWSKHLGVFRLGVDGWWPDEGDWLSPDACLIRNRMYWEGPQLERPNVRPYALHRNGYAGMQRYGWLWSGDIDSTWETLRAQVKVGINTSLSGQPFWGTDTGGFVTTPELTGELYVRWFQFSAFCPLFRSHGRTWKLRLPWGWNTGEYGPTELQGYHGNAGLPDASELHNAEVEPICRKYLDLRYRLLPYLYSVVREAHDTGLPIMRALWMHYANDPRALQCDDEYLWGRDILVAPVTEKGATKRRLYLPAGSWYDFWTGEKVEGGREVERAVDLATLPLYVRAGTILPLGPIKQYATEKVEEELEFAIYPGADGEFVLYEDDGVTFNCERGEFMRLRAAWNDRNRRLQLSLVGKSKMLPPHERTFSVRAAPGTSRREVLFNGTKQLIQM
jgi:alpha-glucosidase (family GH31 glycosyl hydrolase)